MATSPRPRLGGREFIVLIALLQALHALAIDAMLPALGVIARDLGATHDNQRQLIIGVFLLCTGLGSLVPGVLADRFGRKPVLLFCLGVYCVLNLASALATDFAFLLVLRGLTGFATAGMLVLPSAMIRDRFEGDRMAQLQSLVGMVFMIVPVIAPALGQAVMHFASWRWIFGIMASMSAVLLVWSALRLPETLHPEFRQPVRFAAIGMNMIEVLTTRESIGYILGMAATSAMFFTFLNSSQQLIAEQFGAGQAFPLIFGAMACAMALSNFFNSHFVMRFGTRRVSHAGLFVYLAIGLCQVALAFGGHQSLWQFSILMGATMCIMGFISSNFGAIALQPFARTAGAAASVLTFLRMTIGSAGGALIGLAYDGTTRPLALTMLLGGLITLAMVLYSERGRLFRRINPPDRQHGISQQDC